MGDRGVKTPKDTLGKSGAFCWTYHEIPVVVFAPSVHLLQRGEDNTKPSRVLAEMASIHLPQLQNSSTGTDRFTIYVYIYRHSCTEKN